MKPPKQRLSRSGLLYLKANQNVEQTLATLKRLPLFQRRIYRKKNAMPRSFYKYRAIPNAGDAAGRARFEDLMLNNRLWMGTVLTFNDPFEGHADYVIPYRGADLRRAYVRKFREMGFSSAEAKAKVNSDDIADPSRIEKRAREGNLRVLGTFGVCALATDARNPLMWAHYTREHTGICVLLRPVMDFDALIAHPVEYSDVYPVLNDLLEPAEARKTLSIMRKANVWAYENEWRIVALGEPNTHRSFAPEAMAAVILGMRISDTDKAYVLDLMDQRERRYGVRPLVYVATAAKQQYRIEIRKL